MRTYTANSIIYILRVAVCVRIYFARSGVEVFNPYLVEASTVVVDS